MDYNSLLSVYFSLGKCSCIHLTYPHHFLSMSLPPRAIKCLKCILYFHILVLEAAIYTISPVLLLLENGL